MKLPGGSSGAVYRVYGEDEYADGEAQPLAHDQREDRIEDRMSSLRPAALAGIGLLFVVVAIVAVLVLSATANHPARTVATGANANRPVSPQRSQSPATSQLRQTPRATRPTSTRARVRVARANTQTGIGAHTMRAYPGIRSHTGIRVSARRAGPWPVPAITVPAPSSYQPENGDVDRGVGEFGFER